MSKKKPQEIELYIVEARNRETNRLVKKRLFETRSRYVNEGKHVAKKFARMYNVRVRKYECTLLKTVEYNV